MNIKSFKIDSVITRNEPVFYKSVELERGDSSYCGERIILKGHDVDSKIIFFQTNGWHDKYEILSLSYAREAWDEGWSFYPETLIQKIKSLIK